MKLHNLLIQDMIIEELDSTDREGALKEMVKYLKDKTITSHPGESAVAILKCLILRVGSTAASIMNLTDTDSLKSLILIVGQ